MMNKAEQEAKRESWFSHIEACKKSGQSQIAYCKTHGINHAQFGYWRKRYLQTLGLPSKNKFIDITQPLPTKSINLQPLIIKGLNGIEIHLPSTLPLTQLLPIIDFLRNAHV